MLKGVRSAVANDETTKFWENIWIGQRLLKELTVVNLEEHVLKKSIKEYVSQEGTWNWVIFSHLLLNSILLLLAGTKFLHTYAGEDLPYWGYSSYGSFTIKSAYERPCSNNWNDHDVKWKWIWNLPVPQRVCTFLWMWIRRKLLTNQRCLRCQLTTEPNCDTCQDTVETWHHVMRECFEVRMIWSELLGEKMSDDFFSKEADEWLLEKFDE